MAKQVDIYFDPETGDITVKIDGLPAQKCADLTQFLKGALGMSEVKVTETEVQYEGGGGSRGESIHRG